ncbi:MAG: hypothetical protein ACEQSH_01115 [Bacteroidia bacterium]
MTLAEMFEAHGIERVVYVPASDLLPRAVFHAWPFGVFMSDQGMGVGATPEEAILDSVSKRMAKAA